MTHDSATTDPTTALTTRRTEQPQHGHATTAHPPSGQRYKIKDRTAYLGITIRRSKNPDKTGTRPSGPAQLVADLERVV